MESANKPNVNEIKQKIELMKRPRGRPKKDAHLSPEEQEQARKERHKQAMYKYLNSLSQDEKRIMWREQRKQCYHKRKLLNMIDEAESPESESTPEDI